MDQQVTDKNYEEIDFFRLAAILKLETPSVIFFGGSGCHFCDQLKPIYDRQATKYGDTLNFYYIDSYLPENSEGCARFLDGGVPTIRVFWGGYDDLIPYTPTTRSSLGYPEPYLNNYFKRYIEVISQWE